MTHFDTLFYYRWSQRKFLKIHNKLHHADVSKLSNRLFVHLDQDQEMLFALVHPR